MKKLVLIILLLFPYVINRPLEAEKYGILKTYSFKKADFKISYNNVRSFEGNYSNHPEDKGGETYGGISRIYNKDWIGWHYIDLKSNIKYNEIIYEVEFWTMDYYLSIWVSEGFYKLTNQQLADDLFDLRIHLGKKKAIQIINKALWNNLFLDSKEKEWVSNIETLSNFKIDRFLIRLSLSRQEYYLHIIEKNPTQKIFLKGWMKRVTNQNIYENINNPS